MEATQMDDRNFDTTQENNIEFLTGQKRITVTFSAKKWVNKIKRYGESHPEDIDYVENEDGSICGHIPIKWLKISPPRQVILSEDQKAERASRMRQIAARRKKES